MDDPSFELFGLKINKNHQIGTGIRTAQVFVHFQNEFSQFVFKAS